MVVCSGVLRCVLSPSYPRCAGFCIPAMLEIFYGFWKSENLVKSCEIRMDTRVRRVWDGLGNCGFWGLGDVRSKGKNETNL